MAKARETGHLWALVQKWLDSTPRPYRPPSQRDLATRLGVSPTTISDWKYGAGFPRPEHLEDLAAEIGVPYEVVLDAVLRDRGYRSESKAPDTRRTAG